ncbi:MAG: shikimate kinase [Candidatus Sulfotelmatobacter sp.]
MILVGFMGAGKSSVGRAMAEQLGWTFEDLDDRIEQRAGRKVPEIFRDSGEVGFRQAEHTALKELMRELQAVPKRIVALGGGAFVQRENAMLIEAGAVPTVFLDAGVEELWRRCRQQAEDEGLERPLHGSPERFADLYDARRQHYLRASLRQETGGKTVQEIATEVIQALGLDRSREKRGKK